MTASEKLRALRAEGIVVSDAPYEGYSDRVCITEAERDLIADVVEAAETYHAGPSDDYRNTDEESAENETNYWKLDSALTALREHLGKKA